MRTIYNTPSIVRQRCSTSHLRNISSLVWPVFHEPSRRGYTGGGGCRPPVHSVSPLAGYVDFWVGGWNFFCVVEGEQGWIRRWRAVKHLGSVRQKGRVDDSAIWGVGMFYVERWIWCVRKASRPLIGVGTQTGVRLRVSEAAV